MRGGGRRVLRSVPNDAKSGLARIGTDTLAACRPINLGSGDVAKLDQRDEAVTEDALEATVGIV